MISIADAYVVAQKLGISPREVKRWATDLDLDREQVMGYLERYDINKLRVMVSHHEPTMASLPDPAKEHTASLMARILGGK